MSCFNCFEEDDFNKTADGGGLHTVKSSAGKSGTQHSKDASTGGVQAVKVQPIAVPAIPIDDLREVTDNFETTSLIGEGSYGRVYYGDLKNGRAAAIKKLDASIQPEDEFLAQVLLNIWTNFFTSPDSTAKHLMFTGVYGFKVKT
nr:pto-interacting protein 1-like [Ipomoea batatas]GMD66659.1 pto-interacting protein 1-like [Ipomoea batatas]GMD68858.1 pto-interacting protein 1-like [Ipomoea batatas]GMD70871.1 pto-interacting protein 1-like [Ipomoea batatas]GMD72875.1 pto-interacting protein 1-like [Ipomoea batatas]